MPLLILASARQHHQRYSLAVKRSTAAAAAAPATCPEATASPRGRQHSRMPRELCQRRQPDMRSAAAGCFGFCSRGGAERKALSCRAVILPRIKQQQQFCRPECGGDSSRHCRPTALYVKPLFVGCAFAFPLSVHFCRWVPGGRGEGRARSSARHVSKLRREWQCRSEGPFDPICTLKGAFHDGSCADLALVARCVTSALCDSPLPCICFS